MSGDIRATRLLQFDAAHRVMNHESKCATLHGHRYVVEIEAKAVLDKLGRVIDFSVLKALIGGWIDREWDHTTLLFKNDLETVKNVSACPGYKAPFLCDFNPTAENMAEYLLRVVCPAQLGGTDVAVTRVRVWETPNCFAEAAL